jgi:hypothetical protein
VLIAHHSTCVTLGSTNKQGKDDKDTPGLGIRVFYKSKTKEIAVKGEGVRISAVERPLLLATSRRKEDLLDVDSAPSLIDSCYSKLLAS